MHDMVHISQITKCCHLIVFLNTPAQAVVPSHSYSIQTNRKAIIPEVRLPKLVGDVNQTFNNCYLIMIYRDMGIAGLNLKFNKKVKTNVERESIFIIKSHQTGPQFQKNYLQ